jgi:energy-coupling factor transporter ATP-binding protein EcfA2
MNTINFKDYGLEITLTPFINIIGLPSSGKTDLLRMMINQIDSSNIEIDETPISDYAYDFLRKNVSAVLNNFTFKTTYVKEELLFYQNILKIEPDVAFENIEKFTKFFGLDDLLDTKIEYLTTYEKAYVKILSLLIIRPCILGIDDMLTYLTLDQKLKIIKYAKANSISILNVTTNPEELLLGSDIIILDKGRVVAYDTSEKILGNEKELSKVGMHLPFIVEMSTNLNYYDLLKKKYFDMKTLVGELWK